MVFRDAAPPTWLRTALYLYASAAGPLLIDGHASAAAADAQAAYAVGLGLVLSVTGALGLLYD